MGCSQKHVTGGGMTKSAFLLQVFDAGGGKGMGAHGKLVKTFPQLFFFMAE